MTDEPEAGKRQPNLLVLSKITSILDAFTLSRPVLSLSDIRQATGLPASTVQRLVANLVSAGFLDRDPHGYRVGVRMVYWAAPVNQNVEALTLAKPELESLRDLTGETVGFFRESSGLRVCVALAETQEPLRRYMRVGQVMPLHTGSSGRVLLAWRPRLLDEVLQQELPMVASGTITDRSELERAVRQTLADGFAITHDEREDGASGLSAPVFDAQGELLGALGLLGPTLRLSPERLQALVPTVVEAAERLTRIIGGRRPEHWQQRRRR